jgi:hypothetical protein
MLYFNAVFGRKEQLTKEGTTLYLVQLVPEVQLYYNSIHLSAL